MKYLILKRILDIVLSLIFIILTLPLMLIVLLITLFNLGLPLIDIRIPREGKNKQPFYMYKIRTRIYDADGNSHYNKLSKFIDNTGLNELPQLFNVLKGDMSLIGPRAFICGEKLPEGEISPKRYMVKPGIISLSQVYDGRKLSYKATLKCDIEYYDNLSLSFDIQIFFKSLKTIFKRILGR